MGADARRHPVTDANTETLVRLLHEADLPNTSDKLEHAPTFGTKILAFTIVDRESILRVGAPKTHQPHDGSENGHP